MQQEPKEQQKQKYTNQGQIQNIHNRKRRPESQKQNCKQAWKIMNKQNFYIDVDAWLRQGEKLQTIFSGVNLYHELEIAKELKNINLMKAIEYVPIDFKLLEHIIQFLKRFSQSKLSEIKQFVQIILQSDLLKNLLYQMCLAIYDQNQLMESKKIVDLFTDLFQIFKLCCSIIDLRFSPIIYPIELIELVYKDYSESELAKLFNKYHYFLESFKQTQFPYDYQQCPVEPIMIEFDCDAQIIGNLEKNNYLNYHYFILREDYLRDFRQFIYKFKTNTIQENDKQFKLYQEAQLIDFNISNNNLMWIIKLKQYNMDGRRRHYINWMKSKRLASGAMLAFTNVEGYPIVFGVILERDSDQANYKKKFEIILTIKLLQRDIQQFLDLFKCTNIVIENPIIYEASISYLLSLKTIKLPFNNVIVNGSKQVNFPKYISNFNYKIYLQTTNDQNVIYQSRQDKPNNKSLNDHQWKSQGTLDQSQIDALKLMLSAEIALIQGPPGTGKTFCGALAVRNLLANVKLQQLPILVVCYTNHALDQFLNQIIKYVDHQDVLRLGFGCKDPNIIPFMLRSKRRKIKFEWDIFTLVKREIKSLLNKILDQRYFVQEGKNIQNHWPELYDLILGNEYVKQIKDKNLIFKYWIECKIPPNSNYQLKFYCNEKCYLSQVKQIYKYQTLPEINEDEFVDDVEAEMDEYFDSDEEQIINYFMDDYTSKVNKTNYRESLSNHTQTFINRRIPYDYQGISDLQNIKFNPWLLKKEDIQGILEYISHLMLLQDIQKYQSLVKQFQEMSAKLKLLYQDANYEYFNKKKIIGVTITGAAKYTETLKKLDTKILIIEEAAEVLESHLISILTPNIQHLILIGDHQQLKPKLSCYELEQQYKANTSLFQKLFEQGISNVTLTCQRRMKSKFADFTRLIYSNKYQDNIPLQQENKKIEGMNSDLIYFNHSWLEEKDANNTSIYNQGEADMIIEFVDYLIECNHHQENITVLSFYLLQATIIQKALDSKKNLINVKVQTVDNYQGEENEIVIISLVRSNTKGIIGFIKEENRINVALSRARVGLYVFGNFQCIQQNSSPQHLWSRIIALANQKKVLKDHLDLCCIRHKNVSLARTPEEIRKLSPGYCDQICNAPIPNGDLKFLKEYQIDQHQPTEYPQTCNKMLACGHQCQAKCNQQCSLFQCYEQVKKVLPCQHEAIVVCSKYQQNVICQESITQRLPCGHTIICKCADKDKYVRCLAKCEKKLLCGHPSNCKLLCYQTCSPCDLIITKTLLCGHQYQFKCSQLKNGIPPFVLCQQPCIKKRVCGHDDPCLMICSEKCSPCQDFCEKKRDCGHKQPCQKLCSHNSTCSPCENKCTKLRLCGHTNKCSNRCYQECTQCQQPAVKQLPCGHTIILRCFQSVSSVICEQNCLKVRSCGHRCLHPCYKSCQPCDTMVPKQLKCGHQVEVQCCKVNEPYQQDCMKTCDKQLICGHLNQCTQPCSQPCDPCRVVEQQILPCGHVIDLECQQLNQWQRTQCQHPVNRLLPCGHTLRMMCYELAYQVICEQICMKVRSCGHVNQEPCNHPCYQPCSPCSTMVSKQLQCGHQVDVQCCKINEPYQRACMSSCKKKLICGHASKCTQLCSQPCDPCLEMAQKVLPCGHVIDVQCFRKTQDLKCPKPCAKTVCSTCNSPLICNKLCGEPCAPCQNKLLKQLPCGHSKTLICGDKTALCFVIIQKQKDCGEHFENVPCNQRIFPQKKCQEHK